MAVERVYRCDLCKEPREKDDLRRTLIGKWGWRIEDFHELHVCSACSTWPVGNLMDAADKLDAEMGMVH